MDARAQYPTVNNARTFVYLRKESYHWLWFTWHKCPVPTNCGIFTMKGCVTGVTTQLHHGTRTWQILEQKCNLKIHHLKESIHCKSLYSQGIRQCPYEVTKIVKLG
jgi:hypothetical protein